MNIEYVYGFLMTSHCHLSFKYYISISMYKYVYVHISLYIYVHIDTSIYISTLSSLSICVYKKSFTTFCCLTNSCSAIKISQLRHYLVCEMFLDKCKKSQLDSSS